MSQQEFENFKQQIKNWMDSHPEEYNSFVEEMNQKNNVGYGKILFIASLFYKKYGTSIRKSLNEGNIDDISEIENYFIQNKLGNYLVKSVEHPQKHSLVIPYFCQGHNFICNKAIFVEAIRYIGRLLNCDLWDAQIEKFEFGTIIIVENKVKNYIMKHQAGKGLETHRNPKYKGDVVMFKDKYIDLKMYDAGKNIRQKQTAEMKQVIQEAGWNPQLNYLKWEVRYKKPHLSLNKGIGIRLADLVSPKWEQILKDDLLQQYKRLSPMKPLLSPMDKKDCSSADIILIELAETKINNGCTLTDVKKSLHQKVNSLSLLSENDKKARKRQIKIWLDKLVEIPNSDWDLSMALNEKINQK